MSINTRIRLIAPFNISMTFACLSSDRKVPVSILLLTIIAIDGAMTAVDV